MKIILSLIAAVCLPWFSYASTSAPECIAYDKPLPENNAQVLHWKRTTQNQYRDRGHILGVIQKVYPDHSGHEHISVNIGKYEEDTVEIIYNSGFGSLPTPDVGMPVEACGDYITSFAKSGPYPASPDGALIHWVHRSPNLKKHLSGFLVVNGVLYGQEK